jgi:hypothetical protein
LGMIVFFSFVFPSYSIMDVSLPQCTRAVHRSLEEERSTF